MTVVISQNREWQKSTPMPARKKSVPSTTVRLIEKVRPSQPTALDGALPQGILSRLRVLYFRWNLKRGDFIDIGGAVEPLLGYTAEEILTTPHMTDHLLHEDFARKLPGLIAQWSLEQPKHLDFEVHCSAKDGRDVWLLVSGVPEYSLGGEIIAVQAFAQEATGLALARKAAEEGRQLYTHLFRNAPMPLILFDPDTLLVV